MIGASNIYTDQISAAFIQEGINAAERLKAERIAEIIQTAIEKEEYARTALSESLHCVENVRDFVSNPDSILGTIQTKHGEIAEHVEVEIRNGRDILNRINPSATFEGVGRTAPEDYIIGEHQVQSKFINGANKSLNHVIEHLEKYPGFTDNGYYHIPKDQYEVISKIYSGDDTSEFSSRTIKSCKEFIRQIEEKSGKPFTDVVKPGISTYKEVQLGEIDKTLDGYEKEFHNTTKKNIDEIRKEKASSEAQTQHTTDASWGEALEYSAISAVITGTTSAGIKVYAKIKGGKKITSFSLDDWKDIGYDFGKGSVKGAISGLGIYGLSKVVGMSAPFSSSIVSSTMGVSSLYHDYRCGKLTKEEYGDAACALCVEAGLAAAGAAIGQTVIPIPILGAIVGSAVAKSAIYISKYVFGEKEKDLLADMEWKYKELVAKLDEQCRAAIERINLYYEKLGGLIKVAMDPDLNKRLSGSIELCQFLGVRDSDIIHNNQDLDNFILS